VWDGARARNGKKLWYGVEKGAPLNALAGPQPFVVAEQHQRYWVEQDPRWDWRTLDRAGFEQNFRTSQRLFRDVIGTDDPDLSRFRAGKGKLLMWHGWNDQLIFPRGTIDYYERVRAEMGDVSGFARLFMAPGVGHCSGGPGPDTFDVFGALVGWVERGTAPNRVLASTVDNGEVVRTRPLCPYPATARYDGTGDPDSAASFACLR